MKRAFATVTAVGALGALALASGCATKKPVQISATGTFVHEGGKDVLVLAVQTSPLAEVRVNDSSYATPATGVADDLGKLTLRLPLSEPYGAAPQTGTLFGSSSGAVRRPGGGGLYGSSSGGASGGLYGGGASGGGGLYGGGAPANTYGSSGSYSTPSTAMLGPDITLTLNATLSVQKTLGKARHSYGSSSVTFHRPPGVRYNPGTRVVSCVGVRCAGTMTMGQNIRLDFTEIEPNTVVDLGGSKARTVTRTLNVSVDAKSHVDRVPLAEIFQDFPVSSVSLPLKMDLDGGGTAQVACNIPANQLRASLTATMQLVTTGPVRFSEEPTVTQARSVFLVPRGKLLGPAAQAHDIDLVAVVTDIDHPDCKDGQSDGQVTVYDRRTGKQTAQRTFYAGGCGKDYDDSGIEGWVRSQLKP